MLALFGCAAMAEMAPHTSLLGGMFTCALAVGAGPRPTHVPPTTAVGTLTTAAVAGSGGPSRSGNAMTGGASKTVESGSAAPGFAPANVKNTNAPRLIR